MADTPSDNVSSLLQWHRDYMACSHCGLVQRLVPYRPGQGLCCHQCHSHLPAGLGPWRERTAAWVLTALILFVLSNTGVFMGLQVGGFYQEASLLSGVWALWQADQALLAFLVFLTVFLFPLFELLVLAYLVWPCFFNRRLPGQVRCLRWLTKAAPWSMLEIFLLAVLVTAIKLGDMAQLIPGVSMLAFFALVAVLGMAYWSLDKRDLWAWLEPSNVFAYQPAERLYDCAVCHALVGVEVLDRHGLCPRCHHRFSPRKKHSLQRTAALTLAAAILYLPANLLPIMTVETLLEARSDTLLSGVAGLLAHGLWGIAAIVFVASIVVPVAKILALSYLVWACKASSRLGAGIGEAHPLPGTGSQVLLWRQRLFRVTEWIGRWSMVDVFVVTLLTGLVQFGYLGAISPGPALLPFALVVILTMLAAQSFDPRLMWDGAGHSELTLSQLANDAESALSPSRNAIRPEAMT